MKILKSTVERFLIENEGYDLSDVNNIKKINAIPDDGESNNGAS